MDQGRADYQSILSQLASAVVGRNSFYDVAIWSVLCVLCLSANMSFVDFPRLCRLIAADDFLPRSFAMAGRRLVFSVGILYLAVTAGLLLVVFGGITDRLIPLFAIGAFLTFTLSQMGMVRHWLRAIRSGEKTCGTKRPRLSLAINAVGMIATSLALAVIVLAKFSDEAWITIIALPAGILLLHSIKNYYVRLDRRLQRPAPLDLTALEAPVVVFVVKDWNCPAAAALKFALALSQEVIAIHLTALPGPDSEPDHEPLKEDWMHNVEAPAKKTGLRAPKLMMLEASHRNIRTPLLQILQKLQHDYPSRQIAVLIPQVVKSHWWQYLLHTHRARRLRSALIHYGGPRLTLIEDTVVLRRTQNRGGCG